MRASPLRELARRYAKGELSKATYQVRRREIMDSLVSGRSKLSYRDTLAETSKPEKPADRRLLLAAGAGVAVVLLVALVAMLFSGDEATAPEADASVTTEAPATRPGVERIKAMLGTSAWSPMDLEGFISDWRALSAEDRGEARSDYRFQRLLSRVDQELKQEEALAALGDETAQERAEALRSLREALEGG